MSSRGMESTDIHVVSPEEEDDVASTSPLSEVDAHDSDEMMADEVPDQISKHTTSTHSPSMERCEREAVAYDDDDDDDDAGTPHKSMELATLRGDAMAEEPSLHGFAAFQPMPPDTTEIMARADNYFVSVSDPYDGTWTVRAPNPFYSCYAVMRMLYTQSLLAIFYIIGFFVVLFGQYFSTGSNPACWYTFLCILVYAVEMACLMGYEGLQHRLTLRRRAWKLAEPAILAFCFILELVSWSLWSAKEVRTSSFYFVCLLRLACWTAHGITRWVHLQMALRVLCSADRRRYQQEGFDLDMTYVHRNIVAMAWPATNFERIFRNPMDEVVEFLDRKHQRSYRVVNLCSERTYDPAYFHGQTTWISMDDHNPAELSMMVDFCRDTADFVMADPYMRMVAVHCKGGKGRTGAMICAYLMYVGLCRTADDALHHFAALRTNPNSSSFQGVQAPSQHRYVRYFERLLRMPGMRIPSCPVHIRALRLYNLPKVWYTHGLGRLWFVVMRKPCTEREVVFISNESVAFHPEVPDPSTYTASQLRDLLGSDEQHVYDPGNQVDVDGGAPGAAYQLDQTSFTYFVGSDFVNGMSFSDVQAHLANYHADATVPVSMEYKDVADIPELDGDVVVKFFFARNDPNPLTPTMQLWWHTGMEGRSALRFDRSQIDGPPKDKKYKCFPADFAVEVELG